MPPYLKPDWKVYEYEVQVGRVLLVQLQEGDEVRAVEEKEVERRLRSRRLCLKWSRE